MLVGIISTKLASEKIVHFYAMEKIGNTDQFEIYKNRNKILIIVEDDEVAIDKSMIYLYSEYNPELMFYFGLAHVISNEHVVGDVILPNVFFELDETIENTEFKKENLDIFLKNPIFLESYNLQSDYDFEKFGLSIGGICVSGNKDLGNIDLKEKIKLAYEADVYDKNSYIILNEAKKLNILDKFYVISAIYSANNKEGIDVIVENGLYILNFLLDNISNEETVDIEI